MSGEGQERTRSVEAAEAAAREAFMAKPKTLPVIDQEPESAAPAVHEHENGTGKRVAGEPTAAKLSQRVDAFGIGDALNLLT